MPYKGKLKYELSSFRAQKGLLVFFIYFPKETAGLFFPGHFLTFTAKVQFYMVFIYITGVTVAILAEISQKRKRN